MATRWIKLTTSAATKFNAQYKDMLDKQEVTEEEFPPGLFVEFMLDVRAQAQGIVNKQENDDDGRETSQIPRRT